MLYEWDSIESFNIWHDALCLQLGYPITPVNQLTGLPDEQAQKIVGYTTPLQANGKIVAYVEDEYAENLQLSDYKFPDPTEI